MSEVAPSLVWPEGSLDVLILVLVLLVILFDAARTASERLSISVGAIHVHPPTLVALPVAETSTAVGLLGGAIADYLAAADPEPTS